MTNHIKTQDEFEGERSADTLRRIRNDYYTLAENLPGMVYRVFIKENNRMLFFNDMIQPMTGFTVEELRAGEVCSIDPLILCEDRAIVVSTVKRAIQDNQPFEIEYRIRRKDGEIRYFLERGRPIYEEGEPLYIDGVIFDITERKQMEESLKASHGELEKKVKERTAELYDVNLELQKTSELLEKVFCSIDILIAYMDKDFNFLRVNRAYAEADEKTPEFFVGKNHFALYPNEENETIFRKVVETGEPYSVFEKPFVYGEHPEGGVTYWDWSLQPVKEPDGRLGGVVLSLVNVTDRKRAEETARAEFAFRKAIENSLAIGIAAVDLDGRQSYVNPAFCRMVGWSEEELTGKMPPFAYWPSEEMEDATKGFQLAMSGQMPAGGLELPMQRRNGERFDVLVKISPLKDSGGKIIGWVGSVGDITESKRKSEALRVSEKQLRYLSSQLLMAQESERRRIALEIHDSLGQTLSAIKFMVETLVEQMKRSRVKKWIEPLENLIPIIHEGVEEARRIQMDLRPPILDDLGILPTVSWLCRKFGEVYSTVRIETQMDIEEKEVPHSLKIAIYRILQEALNDIAKHSKADLVHLSLKKTEDAIELTIQDNGQGIDLEEALFMKDFKKGFGLNSMKERTELSGGTFTMESVNGAGTTIRVTWPLLAFPEGRGL